MMVTILKYWRNDMEEWQKRLLDEELALSEKIIKLSKTIDKIINNRCEFKPNCSIELLTMQLNTMLAYEQILRIRIQIEIGKER